MFASSFWLLIRTHNRARCQAEIPLIAPSEIVEQSLHDLLELEVASTLAFSGWRSKINRFIVALDIDQQKT